MRRWLLTRRGDEHPINQWLTSLDNLHEDIDRWFDDFSHGFPVPESLEKFRFGSPRVEVLEVDNQIIVNAELPGVESRDLDVRVYPREVTLKAEKRKEDETKSDNVHRSERFYGSISRSIPLPTEIDPDKVTASFKNGILKITMDKIPEEGPGKKIIFED
ncbi:MAG: Hsp20/alpha crystallin family protein [Chitinophagales bacterium]